MPSQNLKIDQLVLCDLAFLSRDNKLNLIGLFESILVHDIPTTHSKICIVGFVTGEPDTKQQVFLSVTDPAQKPLLFNKPIDLTFGAYGKTHIMSELINFPISSTGTYHITISDSKSILGKTDFFVKKTGVSN